MDFVRVGYFIPLNGPLNGHPPSIIYDSQTLSRSIGLTLYQLCGVLLKSVTQERYLGVILTQSLSWSNHISQVSVKANQKLGFIKRNLKGSPQELKRLAYITLVRSGMEYASPVWDPSTSKDQDALERVKRRAARWITSSYDRTTSVTKLLRQLNPEPLDKRRRIYRLTFLYKVLNEHVAVPPYKLDIKQNGRPVRGSVTKQRFVIPRCSTNELKNSLILFPGLSFSGTHSPIPPHQQLR